MTTEPEPTTGDTRRGPSKETADAVLTAAFRILVTEGMAAITPTRLHAETGVARTTIYRHWRAPIDFVLDIVAGATRRHDIERQVYTGDLRTDLEIAVETITDRLADRPVRPLLGALMSADGRPTPDDGSGEQPSDGEDGDGDRVRGSDGGRGNRQPATGGSTAAGGSLSRDYVMGLFAPVADVVAEGRARGRLVDAPIEELVTDLAAPLLVRHTLLEAEVTGEDGRRAVERFLLRWAAD